LKFFAKACETIFKANKSFYNRYYRTEKMADKSEAEMCEEVLRKEAELRLKLDELARMEEEYAASRAQGVATAELAVAYAVCMEEIHCLVQEASSFIAEPGPHHFCGAGAVFPTLELNMSSFMKLTIRLIEIFLVRDLNHQNAEGAAEPHKRDAAPQHWR
jgi:hypothetical protein